MQISASTSAFLGLLLLPFGSVDARHGHSPASHDLVRRGLDASRDYPGFDALKTLFIFGDSLSDTGFSRSDGPLPSSESPLGHPAFPGATTAWGVNWVGALVKNYKVNLVAWNFAKAGAVVDKALSRVPRPDFSEQLAVVKKDCTGVGSSVEWAKNDTLFLSMFGQNDLTVQLIEGFDTLTSAPTVLQFEENVLAMTVKIMDQYMSNWLDLYKLGTRNFVAITPIQFEAIPDQLERVQKLTNLHGNSTGDAFLATLGRIAADFNAQLKKRTTAFQESYPGSTVFYVDAASAMRDVIAHPDVYGYKKTDTFCLAYRRFCWMNYKLIGPNFPEPPAALKATCHGLGVPEILWLDDWHPTSRFHLHLADKLHGILSL
ncbi:hypothetical protein BCR37DRAFT_387806 [Protomyces lactucae-debilis]|uniref:GDSL lipase/esterase n=1 Tax=Protomyces lactucae-debilis TaxID=2754530 RepID=A0A1Y2FD89_PROLT|nr:uncharacterized protein BCR37DRAFT_387806 [Protomyces lactucae-debilis]ORY81567.1 hypothetical protein BCR37DRAFT_387806 [Protomyces lactucae-debilis]